MHFRRKRRGGARFVMIFEETHELILIIHAGEKMLAHEPSMAVAQPILQAFVVGVVETLLL